MFNASLRTALRATLRTATTQYNEVCAITGCMEYGMGASDSLACKLSSLKDNYSRTLFLLANDRRDWRRRKFWDARLAAQGRKSCWGPSVKPTWEDTAHVVRHGLNPMMVKPLND